MNRKILSSLLFLLSIPVLGAAQAPQQGSKADAPKWAIAIHGGAGTIPKDLPEAEKQQYLKSLKAALEIGRDVLRQGGASLDAVEKVVRFLEDDPLFNAGKGAVYTHEGTHELDAAIMDGSDLSCGSVAALKTVKHPISLARRVKEKSPHVFMVGEGAEKFADEMKVERVPNSWFDTPKRREQWQEAIKKEQKDKDTVGAVALDVHGNLAAATSTGGLTNKRFGRLGDVPVIGAGTYANNKTCAISATGYGEEFIKHTVAHDISSLMEYGGLSLQQAADRVIHQKLKPGDGGVIGVARDGSIALVFNSEGMYRGAADSSGRFEVKIWE
ncbi:MAG TPA: isoaspartyl peptidase/L-asparaginase [Thermoanaerobaculia bacterium]|jgi:beta-aspartyl-peptidase (threonine type)|nr:isoaspartyl peptidase/L-asparaginase [Thermoanaerobaculia bacterium]